MTTTKNYYNVKYQIWDRVQNKSSVRLDAEMNASQTPDQIYRVVRTQVSIHVRRQVGNRVWDPVWGQVWRDLLSKLGFESDTNQSDQASDCFNLF